MHKKPLLTLSLAITMALGLPGGAIAQTGGLDEYQEGAPTAGGEQAGVPGGVNPGSGSNGTDNGGQGSGNGDDDASATTDPPPVAPSTPSAGSTGSQTGGGTQGPASNAGLSGAEGSRSGPSANGGGGAPTPGSTSPVVTPSPTSIEVTAAPGPVSAGNGSGQKILLVMAITLATIGAVGTVLYRRWYGSIGSSGPRIAIHRRAGGPVTSSS